MYQRNILSEIVESLDESPVVLINGARQIGKSTLITEFVSKVKNLTYITLDDPMELESIRNDTIAYFSSYEELVALDEVQRAPDIFLPLKKIIDERKKNGQFILSGSANVLTLPKLSESLAGRMNIYTMWPLSQGEIKGKKEQFIDHLFSNTLPQINSNLSVQDWAEIMVKGGYPQSLLSTSHKKRMNWFRSYMSTILQKDIRSLSNIEGLTSIPNILSIIAGRVGNFMNLSDIARIADVKTTTLQRYNTLLKMVFLIVEIPSWHTNYEKKLIKSPKVYINDTGMLAFLRNIDQKHLIKDKTLMGPFFENFIAMELIKQLTWSEVQAKLYHFRTLAGDEVDFVLEGPAGKIIGVEIKAKSRLTLSDMSGLKKLKEICKEKFEKGIILYQGEKPIYFSKDIIALPAEVLWV